MAEISVLGTGIMGGALARRLAEAGHRVTVWNRTIEKARRLTEHGVDVAETPADAVGAGELVVTFLADAEAIDDAVLADDEAALSAAREDTVWIQMSTVGLAIDRLAARAAAHGVAFVDAPVLGTREPAEQGQLLVLAAGAEELQDRCATVFDVAGRRTIWVDERPGAASRLKLVINAWLLGLLEALAESIGLAEGLGLDPDLFLDAIEGGPVGVPYARIKGDAMVAREFPPSFPLRLALKDSRLVIEASERTAVELPLARVVAGQLATAVGDGHGDEDMAAVFRSVRGITAAAGSGPDRDG